MLSEVRRPVLRYYGGKWILAPWVIEHFPPHRIYVEPYAGAASVLLRKPRCYAEVINDLDSEIVSLFLVLRDPAQAHELERLLRLTPYARAEFEISYLPASDPIEQARRTIARSFMGFGGQGVCGKSTGFRANSNRSGTTPAHDWAHYPKELAAFCARLAGVVIENRPALDVIRQHDGPETLHYVDPPYLPETRQQSGSHGYRHEMTEQEHGELSQALHECAGYVVLSGYPSQMYDELYAGWQRVERKALADGAQPRLEVLWLSPKTGAALEAGQGGHQLRLLRDST